MNKRMFNDELHLTVEKCKNTNSKKYYREIFLKFEILINKMSHSFAKTYKDAPLDFEDYKSIAMMELNNLIDNFDLSSNMSFPTFVKTFIFFKLNNEAKKYISKRNSPMNYSVEFNDEFHINRNSSNWNQEIYAEDLVDNKIFSSSENVIVKSLFEGNQTEEIAMNLNRTDKQIKSSVYRIRKKIENSVYNTII